MQQPVHSRGYLNEKRRELRKSLTPAEATLWSAIKNKQLQGKKFRRQHSIENFIVDFYCAEEKLIIELDGQGHYQAGTAYADGDRDDRLQKLGFKVLRFENKLVFNHLDGVLEEIASYFSTERKSLL
jgi:very-short-patch-repair endonuclease